MRNRFWVLGLVLWPMTGARADQPPADRRLTLYQAFDLAIKRSETLAQHGDLVAQALARIEELRGDVMPHIALLGQETLQQSPNSTISAINQTNIPQAQFQLTQPLFSGFREFLAFKAGKRTAQSAAYDRERAESLLFQDVATAYLDLLRLQKEIEIRLEIIKATGERLAQLEKWVRIGRSRDSEVLAARSQLAQTEAEVEITRGQELMSQEVLKFLTGLDDHLIPEDVMVPNADALGSIDGHLDRARKRSDVRAREQDVEVAKLNTKIASRQRWPTVSATADYYLERVGFFQNVKYDAIIAASLPIFEGGVISAQIKEAQAVQRSSEEGLSLAQRTAEREARSAYRNLQWTLAAVKALEKAAQLAAANLKAQVEDYRLALVTNLQVLDSLAILETTRISLNQNQLQAALARIQLDVADGGPSPSEGKKR